MYFRISDAQPSTWHLVLAAQSCPTLCNPMDYSPPGSSVHGILQGRILEALPFPSPGDLPDLGTEPSSSALQTDSLPSNPPEKTTWHLRVTQCMFFLN